MKTADLRIEAAPAYRMPMGWFALAPFFLVLAGVLLLSEANPTYPVPITASFIAFSFFYSVTIVPSLGAVQTDRYIF